MTGKSRLERMILRLTAQRDCLDHVAGLIEGQPGPVLEFGLGKGRTYDHLLQRFPEREIFVFEREIHCPPECVPDARHLLLGDVRDTVPGALAYIGAPAVLAHFDIGTHDFEADEPLTEWLLAAAVPLVRAGGYVVSDRPLATPSWIEIDPPPGLSFNFHRLYRAQ
jgi:hypothetical protein